MVKSRQPVRGKRQPPEPGGVRTRARTLAALRTRATLGGEVDASAFAYLELRSRRLQKRSPGKLVPRRRPHRLKAAVPPAGDKGEAEEATNADREDTLESNSCNLVQGYCDSVTSSSSTKKSNYDRQEMNDVGKFVLCSKDTDDIFAEQEQQYQNSFKEKYNFDPVKEKPLPGRYEWVKLKP